MDDVAWWLRCVRLGIFAVVATAILAPLVPGPLKKPSTDLLRRISVQQTWSMYAPDPQRAFSYLALHAEMPDGSRVALEEAIQARHGWGAIWDWHKRRSDIWRALLATGNKPTANRSWYMRAVCVREERNRGVRPLRIVATRERRRFTPPADVANGAPALSKLQRTDLQTVACDDWPARAMIAADRARRGLSSPDPRVLRKSR